MKIAIIGSGNVGSGLASAANAAGHDVAVSAARPSSAEDVAVKTGAQAAASNTEAVRGTEIVVLAVPHGAVADIVAELGAELDDKVVIDVTNPLTADYSDLTTSGVSAAEQLQQRLPRATVVKALNTVFASRYADPTEGGRPLDVLVAGDDTAAKATVTEFVGSLGFRVLDAGGLRMARALEEIAFLNISLNATNGWTWQSAFALVGPQAAAAS